MTLTPPPAAVAALLEGWHYPTPLPVQWGDMDAAGHINNTIYYRYFESARVELLMALAHAGMDLMGFNGESTPSLGAILAASSCRFKFPLRYPDTAWAASRLKADGFHDFGFELEHVVVSEQHARVAAQGTALLFCFDYKHQKKAPLPPAWQPQLMALLG